MKKETVLAIGEVLIDFIANEQGTLDQVSNFSMNAGGAPANFAVGLARLGINCNFIGKVKEDVFGTFLLNKLRLEKVGIEYLIHSKEEGETGLAFVSLDEDNERDFLFYRNNAVDLKLECSDIKEEAFTNGAFLHFGTVSLTREPSRSATFTAIELCKKNGGKVCFDPNIRPSLWDSEKTLNTTLEQALNKTDILYPSRDELDFILREKLSINKAIDRILKKYPIETIAVKLGKDGCLIKKRDDYLLTIPSFKVPIIDTTGAGDGFNAGFIFGLMRNLTLEEAGIIGNAVGALVIQKQGAMTALPTLSELKEFLKTQKVTIGI